jgi:exopolyphosphatase/guanosine-5'-triphosphate,3'-diphosphate pyrophosphatase
MTKLRTDGSIPEQRNGMEVSAEDFLGTVEKIKRFAMEGNTRNVPGLDSGRSDIILAGALIMKGYVEATGAKSITLSQYALREGIVFDTFNKMNGTEGWKHLTTLRKRSIEALAEKYGYDREHTLFMRSMAKKMFDGLKGEHGYGEKEWELLEAAVYLHDVGTMISADSHHKHSYYIISNSNIPGFSYNETMLIALLSRYHRKSHPKSKHPGYGELVKEDQKLVWALACILRIAEGLDRRQSQCIESITVNVGEEIRILVHPKADCHDPEIELWGGEMRKEMMEQAYGKKVELELDRLAGV